jgi:hypothetical protein
VVIASAASRFVRELRTPPADIGIFSHLIRLVLSDLSITDPEPTEENPSPVSIPTFFANVTGIPAPKVKTAKAGVPRGGRRVGRGRRAVAQPTATTKTPGAPRFTANQYLLATLPRSIRKSGLIARLNFDIFIEQLLELLSQPDTTLQLKFGATNEHFFAEEIAELLLGKIQPGESISTFDSSASASADKLIQSFYRLLSSSVFHNGGTSVLIQTIQSLTSYPRRQAFVSLFLAGFFTEAFGFTMHTRTRLTSWALSPAIVGFPLPEFSLKFVGKLAEEEKLHVDIRRTIVASTVAYFKYQEVAKIDMINGHQEDGVGLELGWQFQCRSLS